MREPPYAIRRPAGARRSRRPLPHTVEASEEPTAEMRAAAGGEGRSDRAQDVGPAAAAAGRRLRAVRRHRPRPDDAGQVHQYHGPTEPGRRADGGYVPRADRRRRGRRCWQPIHFTWEIYLDPSRYKAEVFTPEKVALAAQELGIEPAVIMEAIGQRRERPRKLIKNATRQQCDACRRAGPGAHLVLVRRQAHARYPQGPLAAHLIGFADADQLGLSGVEAFYDDWLRSARQLEHDAAVGAGRADPDRVGAVPALGQRPRPGAAP